MAIFTVSLLASISVDHPVRIVLRATCFARAAISLRKFLPVRRVVLPTR